MKRAKRVLAGLGIFVIIAAALAAFLIYNPKKALKLILPDLSNISSVSSTIRHDSVYTNISMVFQNKNPYKLAIDTIHFDVKLNDTLIAHETAKLNIGQGRFDVDTVQLPINLDAKHIKKLIKHLQGSDSTSVEVSGFIVYETIFGRTRLNFDKTLRIEVPIPPQIKVLKVERGKFNYRKKLLKAVAHILVINRGKNLNLELTNVHYDLRVKNTLQAKGTIKRNVRIKPGASTLVDIPMNILVYHPLKTAMLINLDRDRLDYTLSITCGIKENISARSYTSQATIEASGMLELVK